MHADLYRLVRLPNGSHSIHSAAHRETFHPVIGPVAEALALYVEQPRLRSRLQGHEGRFVIWDVGLGAAANVLTLLRSIRDLQCPVRIVSFDRTLEPLEFGLRHAAKLGYFSGYEAPVRDLMLDHCVRFQNGNHEVDWSVELGEFPRVVRAAAAPGAGARPAAPHLILFDAYSPATNPEMWTLDLFSQLFHLLDPGRPCVMPTYSRSTLLRVTLLLAGFCVGRGRATGEKEETTLATNRLELIEAPLDWGWLARARRSTSAEPLAGPVYCQAPLSRSSWERLCLCPQFQQAALQRPVPRGADADNPKPESCPR